MHLRWCFSGGILFSLTFHTFLISTLLYTYPEIENRSELIWKEFPLLSKEKNPPISILKNEKKELKIISVDKIIFPDLVLIRQPKKTSFSTKKPSLPKQHYTLSKILTQLEKSPKIVYENISSNKKLSAPVVSLLSLLPPSNVKSKVHEKKAFIFTNEQNNHTKFEAKELKSYLNRLSKFLSEDWEVPLHLKESNLKVAIIFEINKNGKILNWKLGESGSPALHNSVRKLMKNLQFLPPLPKSYPENSYIFGVRFSPTIPKK